MPLVARHALLVVALLAVLLVGLQRASGGASTPSAPRFEPFPADFVARAAPLPAYADGPATRIRQQLDSVNAMWAEAFRAAGAEYTLPKLVEAGASDCSPSAAWAGLYCVATQQIVIDLPGHLRRNEAVGGGLSDVVLGYIVAHEAGHHVQLERGADPSVGETLRSELHADCLAGVWGKAAGLPLPPTWMYGEDPEHGTAAQRIEWLNRGYLRARPADCDAIWAGSTSP